MHTKYFHLVLNKFFDGKMEWKVFPHSTNNAKDGLSISVSIPDAISILRTLNDCLPKMGINPTCILQAMRTTSVTLIVPDIQTLIGNSVTQQFIQTELALKPVTKKDFLGKVLLSDIEKKLVLGNKPEGGFTLGVMGNKIIFSEILFGKVVHSDFGDYDELDNSLAQALEKINAERGYKMPKSLFKFTFEFLAYYPDDIVNSNLPTDVRTPLNLAISSTKSPTRHR